MARYGQYCALAKALDLVGDRWTLLIVRELLSLGPARYTDLRAGLPGIATNLLANRLREMEKARIIRREEAPPPIAATLFHLTPRGEALKPAIIALGTWGVPLLATAPAGDICQAHWLKFPVEVFLRDAEPKGPPIAIQVHDGDESVVIETSEGNVRFRLGEAEKPDAVISGPTRLIAGLLMGGLPLKSARRLGLKVKGNVKLLRRLERVGVPH